MPIQGGMVITLQAGRVAIAATLLAAGLLIAPAARAVDILSDSTDLRPGAVESLEFVLTYPSVKITVTFSPKLTTTVVKGSDCELIRKNDQPIADRLKQSTVFGDSSSGTLMASVPSGTYCLVVRNPGKDVENTQLHLTGVPIEPAASQLPLIEQVYAAESKLMAEGRYADAETMLQNLLASERAHPTAPENVFIALGLLGPAQLAQGKLAEAEDTYRQLIKLPPPAGAPPSFAAIPREGLASVLLNEGRSAEARSIIEQSLQFDQSQPASDDSFNATVTDEFVLVSADHLDGRMAEAESSLKDLLARDTKMPLVQTALLRLALAKVLDDNGQVAEAQKGYDQETTDLNDLGAFGAAFQPMAQFGMSANLEHQGRYADAELAARQSVALTYRSLSLLKSGTSPSPLQDAAAYPGTEALGRLLRLQSDYAEAASVGRQACRLLANGTASGQGNASPLAQALAGTAANCELDASLSLWSLGAEGLGKTSADAGGVAPGLGVRDLAAADLSDAALRLDAPAAASPDIGALRAEAFERAQQATLSAAGQSISLTGALAAARAAGAGPTAEAYEQALAKRRFLQASLASPLGPGAAANTLQQGASDQIPVVDQLIAQLAHQLQSQWGAYWDYRSPAPVSVASLQAGSGPDAALLHGNEALVLWMVAPGKDKGLVFAVTKDKVAWAQIGLSGDELDATVKALRAEIDPQKSDQTGQAFDRKTAHALYVALLGDPAIQQVIDEAGVDTLLVVPTGPMTSLPPSLLVVDEPTGSDTDPKVLRSTHWLIGDKAIAILPSVSSLRTLRVLLPQARAKSGVKADLPLLALADPDFHGDHVIPVPQAGVVAPAERSVPTAQAATVDGRPKAEVLASLRPLYGTLAEGQALAKLLDAPDHDLLLGPAASKTELLARQTDGSLVRTRVISFSTHGLITGDFTGLTEPALALAHPATNADATDDGLLTASQAAGLKLDADWVVLSACNTASPEAPGAEGLSGLARAFFYAGANSLLVSHWRVRDDAAQRLVTETFRLRSADPKLSKAKALQKSIISLLNDQSLDARPGQTFANPQAWAPFVVVGEGE